MEASLPEAAASQCYEFEQSVAFLVLTPLAAAAVLGYACALVLCKRRLTGMDVLSALLVGAGVIRWASQENCRTNSKVGWSFNRKNSRIWPHKSYAIWLHNYTRNCLIDSRSYRPNECPFSLQVHPQGVGRAASSRPGRLLPVRVQDCHVHHGKEILERKGSFVSRLYDTVIIGVCSVTIR